jgi:hypothetical protein
MQVITAALAFAIVMLVLSMVVSTLVETIHRIFGMRESGLYVMLGRLYDEILIHYSGEGTSERLSKSKFQTDMSENRAPISVLHIAAGSSEKPGTPASPPKEPAAGPRSWAGLLSRGRGLSTLTTAGFMERLGSSEMGKVILKKAESEPLRTFGDEKPNDAVLQDIAQKFEAFSNEASVFFERRARTLSIVVAMILAFAVYVDPIEIFSTFVRNPALAESVISRSDATSRAFEAGHPPGEKQVSQPPVAPSGESLQAFQQAAKGLDALKKEYADALVAIQKTQKDLSDLGVPIGWNDQRKKTAGLIEEQVVCEAADKQSTREVSKKEDCRAGETPRTKIVKHVLPTWSTILALLFGGLLVGLGGPFWYDMVKNLTSIRDLFRGAPAPAAAAATPVPAALPQETPQPRTPVDIFKAAYVGEASRTPPAARRADQT